MAAPSPVKTEPKKIPVTILVVASNYLIVPASSPVAAAIASSSRRAGPSLP